MSADPAGWLFPYDYCYLWAAGKIALSGGNVYDKDLLAYTMQSAGWAPYEGVWGFTHPPWTLWAYLPFSYFSFQVARVLWLGFLAVLLGLIIRESLVLRKLRPEVIGRLDPSFLAYALMLYPATLKIVSFGQVSFLLGLGLLLFLRLTFQGRPFAAGLGLSLVLLKPHLLAPFLCAVFANALLRRDWRLCVGTVVGLLAQQSVCSLLYPQGLAYFISFVPSLIERSVALPGATVIQILSTSLEFPEARPFIVGGAVACGIVTGLRRSFSLERNAQWLLPLSLLAAPYSFSHEFILLIPAYLTAISGLVNRFGETVVRYGVLLTALMMVFILIRPRHEIYTIVIPASLFLSALVARGRKPGITEPVPSSG